jgi:uncharacterized spore protein YtfJ
LSKVGVGVGVGLSTASAEVSETDGTGNGVRSGAQLATEVATSRLRVVRSSTVAGFRTRRVYRRLLARDLLRV